MRDSVILGAVAGIIGGAVMLAINLILFVGGFVALSQLHQGARAVLPPGGPLGTASALALGLVVNLVVAMLLGVLAVWLLNVTGRDYAWLKGLLFGGAAWLGLYGLLGPLAVPAQVLRPDILTSASLLAGYLAFGLVTFLVAARPVPREHV